MLPGGLYEQARFPHKAECKQSDSSNPSVCLSADTSLYTREATKQQPLFSIPPTFREEPENLGIVHVHRKSDEKPIEKQVEGIPDPLV